MRILVTGANGVVGKILSDVLKKRKHDVFTGRSIPKQPPGTGRIISSCQAQQVRAL